MGVEHCYQHRSCLLHPAGAGSRMTRGVRDTLDEATQSSPYLLSTRIVQEELPEALQVQKGCNRMHSFVCMCVKKSAHDIEGTLTEQSLPLS